MTEGQYPGSGDDELATRRERVVNAVLARIAAAPRAAVPERIPRIDIAVWARPALAAAAVIMIVATASVIRGAASDRDPNTVAESLGLASPLTRFLETGQVDPWDWLTVFGGRR
jgi:hypothetical protein